MSLNDICYKQIKGDFWYGLFGDFKLIIDKRTGFFNATKLCSSAGKQYKHWVENKQTKSLLDFTQKADVGIPTAALYEIKGDNKDELTSKITGTYVHKKLILSLAIWISHEFYFKCEEIVSDYFIQEFNRIKEDNENSLDKLKLENTELNEKIETVTETNIRIRPLASPYTQDPSLHPCFIIYKKEGKYRYGTIRVQQRSLSWRLKMIEAKYPDFEIIYKKEQDPNGVKLFRLMVENLKISSKGCEFNTSMTEEELLEEVDELYDSLI